MSTKKELTIAKTKLVGKKWKIWTILSFYKASVFWRQKWVADILHGNSLAVRRISPGRIIIVLFWTKYANPRQIKPGTLTLFTSRGQRNLCTVFIFVGCEEKGCYRIVSLGHQNFDCRSYCGLLAAVRKVWFIHANLEAMILVKQGSECCNHSLSITSHDHPERREKPIRIFSLVKKIVSGFWLVIRYFFTSEKNRITNEIASHQRETILIRWIYTV